MIYPNILNTNQKKLLPLIKSFSDFYLAGGTSLSLQLGHRESIDYDMFKYGDLDTSLIDRKIRSFQIEVKQVLV